MPTGIQTVSGVRFAKIPLLILDLSRMQGGPYAKDVMLQRKLRVDGTFATDATPTLKKVGTLCIWENLFIHGITIATPATKNWMSNAEKRTMSSIVCVAMTRWAPQFVVLAGVQLKTVL